MSKNDNKYKFTFIDFWKIRARVTPSAKADLTPNNFSVLTL